MPSVVAVILYTQPRIVTIANTEVKCSASSPVPNGIGGGQPSLPGEFKYEGS